MAKWTDRELMLLLNGVAFTVDLLHKSSKGTVSNSTQLTSMESVRDFVTTIHKQQPTVSYKELDELFTKLANTTLRPEATSAEEKLMNLPPSSEYMS